jgi:N-acetylglutamate synthase-like GNAT family acetyltransferase
LEDTSSCATAQNDVTRQLATATRLRLTWVRRARAGDPIRALPRAAEGPRSARSREPHRDRHAIAAVAADGTIAGIARYMRAPDAETAEVAIAVVDRWTGRGIATLLLEPLAAEARSVEIRRFTRTASLRTAPSSGC